MATKDKRRLPIGKVERGNEQNVRNEKISGDLTFFQRSRRGAMITEPS
jgi:hypothetical protein